MIKSNSGVKDREFQMQARMTQFVDTASGQARNASAFTSFAFREINNNNELLIQLQVTSAEEAGHGLVVLLNQSLLEIPPGFRYQSGKPFVSETQVDGSISVYFDSEGIISTVFVKFSTGFSFNIISTGLGALSVMSFAVSDLSGQGYTGLLGSFDGVPENDFTSPLASRYHSMHPYRRSTMSSECNGELQRPNPFSLMTLEKPTPHIKISGSLQTLTNLVPRTSQKLVKFVGIQSNACTTTCRRVVWISPKTRNNPKMTLKRFRIPSMK